MYRFGERASSDIRRSFQYLFCEQHIFGGGNTMTGKGNSATSCDLEASMSTTAVIDPLTALPEHEAWLRTSLFARLGNRDEVEEVMQEVAVAAANQAAKAEPVDRIGPWLYRVAMRQMLLFRRKAGRRKKLINNVALVRRPSEVDTQSRSPLEFLCSQERAREVRDAMVQMSERDRQLLMLKYVEGMSYGEIAAQLGVTASSVQSRLHRARALLRSLLIHESDDKLS
jgi:RNA polymerase sigma-70 factor (ECF subfamily)